MNEWYSKDANIDIRGTNLDLRINYTWATTDEMSIIRNV